LPSHYSLQQNYPNPFNPETRITFECPVASHVGLYIFDMAGRLVRTLADNSLQPGRHTILWDGRDDRGRNVASGIYLCSMTADGFKENKKMTLIR
jgi:flagellar hook assembly protein FlgD